MKKLLIAGALLAATFSMVLGASAAPVSTLSTIATQYGMTLTHDGFDVQVYTPTFTTSDPTETITVSGWQLFEPDASYTPKIKYSAVKKGTFSDTVYSSTTVDGKYTSSSWFAARQLPSVPNGSGKAVRINMTTGNYNKLKLGGNVYDGL